jgi:UDP-N-acetylmuramoyl-tripeptide--D-alanyl-D-alanine ligase
VLGDMGEVGDQGPAFHAEVGAYARARGIARCGRPARCAPTPRAPFGPGGAALCRHAGADRRAGRCARRAASVLVKGSRFMKMERVVPRRAAPGSERPCCLA